MNLKFTQAVVLLIFIMVLGGSCHNYLAEVKSSDYYFEYEYLNRAWGFNHFGFIITPEGKMYTFDKATPWAFPQKGVLSVDSLNYNISRCIKKDTIISRSHLENYKHLAGFASVGKITPVVVKGADMGVRICKILVPDSTNVVKSYREIVLTHNGDTECHNLAPEAWVIAEWLTKMRP